MFLGPQLWNLGKFSGREYLLEGFSVADAYLVTVLNRTAVTTLELASWPALHAYHKRLRTRPSVAKAMAEELTLYQAQQARHQEIGAPAVATPFGVTTTDFRSRALGLALARAAHVR